MGFDNIILFIEYNLGYPQPTKLRDKNLVHN